VHGEPEIAARGAEFHKQGVAAIGNFRKFSEIAATGTGNFGEFWGCTVARDVRLE
jgi:hypothetical protein